MEPYVFSVKILKKKFGTKEEQKGKLGQPYKLEGEN